MFTWVASRDVYIPCPSYLSYFLQILRPGISIHSDSLRPRLCRSLTFAFDSQNTTGFCLSELLHNIKLFGALPHMRTLAIRYSKFAIDDIFDCYQYIDLPDQIENLEVSFSEISVDIQPLRVDPPWYLP